MSKKVYKIGLAGYDDCVELSFPVGCYEVDTTAAQVFADWLEENEKYPLNLKAIRETQRT